MIYLIFLYITFYMLCYNRIIVDNSLVLVHNRLMNSTNDYMNEVFRIINGALRLDTIKVRNYTSFLAAKFEKSGEETLAIRLRKLLEESDKQLHPTNSMFSSALPVDAESRFPLIERVEAPLNPEPSLILGQDQWDIINEFLSVAKSRAQIEDSAISMLMYGPPGTGKSRLARFLASELGLDLYIARLDGLISSFLGSTSKNIRALFEFAAKAPCILFLDEFDAIAKLRGDNLELGELKRVVNSFIQNLDSLGSQSIVIAATNHENLLDSAVWRRFNYRISLAYPKTSERLLLWEEYLSPGNFTGKEIEILCDLSEGLTGSDIKAACVRLARRQLISGRIPDISDAFSILKNYSLGEDNKKRFLTEIDGCNMEGMVELLRKRNSKLYTFPMLEKLLGVSKATIHRRMSGGKNDGYRKLESNTTSPSNKSNNS